MRALFFLRTWMATPVCVVLLAATAAAAGDARASILDIEWLTPAGYERCAAVVTQRRGNGIYAWTAAHCAQNPYSRVRFFSGYEASGSTVQLLYRSTFADAAEIYLNVDPRVAAQTPPAVARRALPAMGTTVSIIGHPVAALRAVNEGRWTVTYGRMGETGQSPDTGAPQFEVYCERCGPGDSGSGVFAADGRLLGIVYGVTEIENVAGGRLPDGRYADVIPVRALRRQDNPE